MSSSLARPGLGVCQMTSYRASSVEAGVGCVSDDLIPCRSLLLIQIRCKLQLARELSTNQLSMEWKTHTLGCLFLNNG